MTHAYINYPNPHITLHRNGACGLIAPQHKPHQRHIRIDAISFEQEIGRFRSKEYRFAASAGLNDIWLEIDFGDPIFEEAVVIHIQKLIGAHYAPIADATVKQHC